MREAKKNQAETYFKVYNHVKVLNSHLQTEGRFFSNRWCCPDWCTAPMMSPGGTVECHRQTGRPHMEWKTRLKDKDNFSPICGPGIPGVHSHQQHSASVSITKLKKRNVTFKLICYSIKMLDVWWPVWVHLKINLFLNKSINSKCNNISEKITDPDK